MRVLVACEESQVVCKAFRARGHEAYSCDIIPCSGGHPEWHLQGDCLFYLNDGWDLLIAHPPCTYMSKAGARWMYPKSGVIDIMRLSAAQRARDFFLELLNCNIPKICIENPVPLNIVDLPKCTQKIQPYEFGHPFSKATCLWLKNLPKLEPTCILTEYKPFCPSNCSAHSRGAGGSRGVAFSPRSRSKTFDGIAAAMAEQWGRV